MNDLYKALGEISSIRRQLALSTEFRGYGPLTLAATGVVALIAALTQQLALPDAAHHTHAYLAIWLGTAAFSASLIALEALTRSRRIHSGIANEMIYMAVEQFLPAAGAGLLVTAVLALGVPASLWMLPGLWQIIFSLGVFSSCRFLPRPMVVVGVWYMLTGLTCLTVGNAAGFNPWVMGLPFAIGQMLVAGVLFNAKESGDEV